MASVSLMINMIDTVETQNAQHALKPGLRSGDLHNIQQRLKQCFAHATASMPSFSRTPMADTPIPSSAAGGKIAVQTVQEKEGH